MRTETALTKALFSLPGQTAREVSIPHTWNALDGQDGGADYFRGVGTYKICLPDPTPGKRQYIEIQGANHIARVWCNGSFLGEHRGGFSAFRFELTAWMRERENTLSVEVTNEVCQVYPQRADFTFFGGLYRQVRWIETEQAHFDLLKDGSQGVFVTPWVSGRTRVDVFPVHAEGGTVRVRLLDGEGQCVAQGEYPALDHTYGYLTVEQPHLWQGVEDPYLYTLEAELWVEDALCDRVCTDYGYRSFRVDAATGFWLNGKSHPLHGVCRHQCRKDKGWAISREDHEEDMDLICQVGANTIRLAHYQHDGYFYDLCDQRGMVVWAEIPFISQFLESREAYDNTISQMTELIAQNYNHPSICFWGIGNELTIGGFQEALYRNLWDLNALCKRMDPSRLTTMAQIASVPHGSEHNYITDVVSYNYYFGWYNREIADNGPAFDRFHALNPDRPFGISEYGVDHYVGWHSATPINHDYTEEYAVIYHHELLKTFAARPYIWATHMWNMFDFAVDARDEGGIKGLNTKGLVSHDRKLRKDSYYVYQAFWTKAPMVHITGRRFADRAPGERTVRVFTNGDTVTLELNGKVYGTRGVVDHQAVFEELPLAEGENMLTASIDGAKDTITLNGVKTHNTAYDLPDLEEAMQAGNWFEEALDGEKTAEDSGYDVTVPIGILLEDPQCLRAVKGWIMRSSMPQSLKLVAVARLTNWRAMWADRTLDQLSQLQKNIAPEEFATLDKLLRRIKRT